MTDQMPDGLEYIRTTDQFDQDHHPAGLRRAHRVADGVWGRLAVHSGSLGFVFEDQPGDVIDVHAGGVVVIPPGRYHHVEFAGPVTFALEFHREPATATLDEGEESTGLVD